jgi:hypothetical protein
MVCHTALPVDERQHLDIKVTSVCSMARHPSGQHVTEHTCSACRRSLFAAAGVRVPPGGVLPSANSSSSSSGPSADPWQQLLMAIALQLLRWPQQQWMLKLDRAAGTTGLAVLDLGAMQVGFCCCGIAVPCIGCVALQMLLCVHC